LDAYGLVLGLIKGMDKWDWSILCIHMACGHAGPSFQPVSSHPSPFHKY